MHREHVGTMKKILLVGVLIIASAHAALSLAADCDDWNILEKMIRDGKINKAEAKKRIIRLQTRIEKEFSRIVIDEGLYFPVKRYGPAAIGGVRGSGFRPKGYDFYDGNRHGGHPAHDLFVKDVNQDAVDDDTGQPVEVVAYASGVVLATNLKWEYPSEIRSGKYVWVFSPALERYCYYVHLNAVLVKPGDVVKAGQVIGLLGRTGKNAFPRRSPTHLHFSCLSFDGGNMTPYNTYQELLHARTSQNNRKSAAKGRIVN